jgi:hypothetical protein
MTLAVPPAPPQALASLSDTVPARLRAWRCRSWQRPPCTQVPRTAPSSPDRTGRPDTGPTPGFAANLRRAARQQRAHDQFMEYPRHHLVI